MFQINNFIQIGSGFATHMWKLFKENIKFSLRALKIKVVNLNLPMFPSGKSKFCIDIKFSQKKSKVQFKIDSVSVEHVFP